MLRIKENSYLVFDKDKREFLYLNGKLFITEDKELALQYAKEYPNAYIPALTFLTIWQENKQYEIANFFNENHNHTNRCIYPVDDISIKEKEMNKMIKRIINNIADITK